LIFLIPNWNPLLKIHACLFAPWKNSHCAPFFDWWYANVFGNMWHSSIGRPDVTYTDSLKNIMGHLYIFQRNIFILFVTGPVELLPGNAGDIAD
jgi:hypothetical protein